MNKLLLSLTLCAVSAMAAGNTPVLVELFTSEGCSSCPPADELLAKLNAVQPIPGVDIIVLSEHVDYWNQLGWKDPYSAELFSDRQRRYATVLRSDDVYTPEAVIDGRTGVVGSNSGQVLSAIREAGKETKTPLTLSAQRDGNQVKVKVEQTGQSDVWVALVEASATSRVMHGENGGRTLQHVGVVRSLQHLKDGAGRIIIDPAWGAKGLRVVAFAQDKRSLRIVGAAQAAI
jgi:hypothetical protein